MKGLRARLQTMTTWFRCSRWRHRPAQHSLARLRLSTTYQYGSPTHGSEVLRTASPIHTAALSLLSALILLLSEQYRTASSKEDSRDELRGGHEKECKARAQLEVKGGVELNAWLQEPTNWG